MNVTRALSCPSCGGLLSLREGDVSGSCRHCGLGLRRGDGVARYYLPPVITATDALRSVRRRLTDGNARRGALRRSKVDRPRLFLVPFWHVSAQVSGFSFGLDPVFVEEEIPVAVDTEKGETMSVFGRTRTVRTRKGVRAASREIRFFGSLNISAANLEPLGIPSLGEDSQLAVTGLEIQRTSLPEGLEVLDAEPPGDGVAVDPSVPLSQAVARSERYFDRLARGSARGLEQRWQWYTISCRRVSLVFYPLWVVDFRYDGEFYRAVLDGVSGQVARGVFPGRRMDENVVAALAAAAWASAIPFMLSMLAGGGASDGIGSCLPGLLLAAGLAGAGTWKLLGLLDSTSRKGSDVVV